MKFSFVLLLLLILIFLGLNLPHLLEFTPVWPDEAWIADVALNILKTGRASTDIWNDMIPGAPQHVLWYPPVFLYLLSFWFKMFGFSIVSQRFLSIVITSLFIVVFFIFCKLLIRKTNPKLSGIKASVFAFLGSLFLIIDPTFLKSAVISRPEILVLVFVTCSAIFIHKSLDIKVKANQKTALLIISGLLIGLSTMVHFLAVIFLFALIIYRAISTKKFFFSKNFYFFIISAMLPVIVWFLVIMPDLDILKNQLEIFAQDRNLTPRYLDLQLLGLPLINRILFINYSIVTLAFFIFYLLIKKKDLLLISLVLITAWVFAYFGKIEWYAVYISPFICTALILILVYSNRNKDNAVLKNFKFLAILIIVVLLIINVSNYINIFLSVTNKSYFEFEEKVNLVIPRGKTIYLSSIPDVYYKFRSDNSYKLYKSPLFKTNSDNFIKVLKNLDYVIINYSFIDGSISDILYNYLREYADRPQQINGGGYSVFVYKLRHKD